MQPDAPIFYFVDKCFPSKQINRWDAHKYAVSYKISELRFTQQCYTSMHWSCVWLVSHYTYSDCNIILIISHSGSFSRFCFDLFEDSMLQLQHRLFSYTENTLGDSQYIRNNMFFLHNKILEYKIQISDTEKFLRKYWGSPIWDSIHTRFSDVEGKRYSSKLITLRCYQYIGDIHDAHRVLSLVIKYGGMNLRLPILRSVFASYGSFKIELKMKSVVVIVLIALFCSVCSAAPSSEGRNHSFF